MGWPAVGSVFDASELAIRRLLTSRREMLAADLRARRGGEAVAAADETLAQLLPATAALVPSAMITVGSCQMLVANRVRQEAA